MADAHLDRARKEMFDADRKCREACDRLLLSRVVDAKTPRGTQEELRKDLHGRIADLESAYRKFFLAVCRVWPCDDERESCLDDLAFRHGQQTKSLSYISGGAWLLGPLAEILCDPETPLPVRQLCALRLIPGTAKQVLASRRRARDMRGEREGRFVMSISALFADLDVEKLEENEETGALIEWLRQELREDGGEQKAEQPEDRSPFGGASE